MAHLAWNDAEPAATTFKSQQRWGAGLWIALGLAVVVGQLMRVRSDLGGTPLLSANDRSRWSTIRSLVDHGTYAVDQVVLRPDGKRDREWYSIDMVKHPGPDGKEHFYSSKPPLFPTLVAGLYWVFRTLTGATLGEQPFYVVRSLLLIVNVVPLAGYWYLAAKLGQRWCRTEWEFGYLMAAVTLGTLLTPFAVTLNNHLPAAVGAAFAGWFVLRIVTGVSCRWYDFAGAGLAAGWAAVNELPALLFLVMVGWVCLRRSTGLTLTAFLPPVLAWFVAFEACNFVAHGSWIPPYMHRSDGPVLAVGEIDPPEERHTRQVPEALRNEIRSKLGYALSDQAQLIPRARPGQWMLWDAPQSLRLALSWQGRQLTVRQWGNWYEYEGTYWLEERKRGVDRGEQNLWVYAFHVLVGHHGIFSLTPIWWLAVVGAYGWYRHEQNVFRSLILGIGLLSLVLVIFYISRPPYDRNYGGVSCGMRWLVWMTPLWLFCLVGALPLVTRYRWSRAVALLLLAVSVFSVSYALPNPWRHPWLFDYWTSLGWIHYP